MTDNQLNEPISQYTHERDMARLERIIHRLIILCMIMVIAFVSFVVVVANYESQFEVVEETTTEQVVSQNVRATGNSDAVLAGIGDATNGSESEADSQEESDNKTVSEEKEKVNERG